MKRMAGNKPKTLDDQNIDARFTVISVVVTMIIVGLWISTYHILKDDTDRGTIGDMFGSVNALFSGLALAGIILTILLQRKELKLQREELKNTRAEFATQNETLKIQRFENTFFNILNLHHQIVSAIDYRYYKSKEKEKGLFTLGTVKTTPEDKEAVIINGRDVFRYRYKLMLPKLKEQPEKIEQIYLEQYESAQTDFGHYFRNLYRMIKLVDQTDFFYDSNKVTQEQIHDIKYRYTSIIRSQISDYELIWIFYNCISVNGIDKFKPLIEQYSFFKNLPHNLVADQTHLSLYHQRAFNPNNE
jgi:hypothetical protein